MGDDATLEEAGPHWAVVWLGLPAASVTAIGSAVWIASFDNEPSYPSDRLPLWCGGVIAFATVSAVAAILALTRTRRDGRTRVAAIGVALVALGSGIGRTRLEVYVGQGWGDVVDRLDTRWPVVALGLALVVGSAVRARGAPVRHSASILSSSYLTAVALGYAIVTVAMRDIVTGTWVS